MSVAAKVTVEFKARLGLFESSPLMVKVLDLASKVGGVGTCIKPVDGPNPTLSRQQTANTRYLLGQGKAAKSVGLNSPEIDCNSSAEVDQA